MGLNSHESVSIGFAIFSLAVGIFALTDYGWAVIRDRDGIVYYMGLRETEVVEPTLNGTAPSYIIDNDQLDALFAGNVASLGILVGGAAAIGAVVNVFLVGSGNRDRDKGHLTAMAFYGLAGLLFVVSCGAYSFLHPSNWEFHDDNEETITLGPDTYAFPMKSIDHFGTSFVTVIIASQILFAAAVILYFAHSRVNFI